MDLQSWHRKHLEQVRVHLLSQVNRYYWERRLRTGTYRLTNADGADAVVMMEDTVLNADRVEIFTQIHPFKNVGAIGEDVQKGEIILNQGRMLRPCDIAVLASLGIGKINVFKRPLVLVIPTGEELVPRNRKNLMEGEVYETNGLMSAMYIRKWGGIPRLLDIVTDSPEKINEAIISTLMPI